MIFSRNKKIVFALLLTLSMGFVMIAHAQTENITELDAESTAVLEQTSYESSINEGDFEFEITPENPGPYEQVFLKITSNLVDANRYPITWTVDGVEVASGIGQRTITVTTKDYGTMINISVTINLIDSVITKEAILMPQDVTLLWEAVDSYVPPFYEGKRLPAPESLVRIISLPNFLGNRPSAASKNAVYTWSRNKSIIPNAGGYGKDSILIQHNRVRPNEFIEVTSSATNGGSQAMSYVTVPFFNPSILFYERNATTGIRTSFSKNTLPLDKTSTIIEAEPYFFSVVDNNPNSLKIDWKMNNKPITVLDARKKTSLTVQKPEGSGNATLGISVENITKLFQSADKILSIVFIK